MPTKPKMQRLPRAISDNQPDGAEDYERAEKKERNIIGPPLRGADMGPMKDRVPLSPVTSVAKSPDVEFLLGSLFSVIMSETLKLTKKSKENADDVLLDPGDMGRLAKLVDGTKQITKLRIELEQMDQPEELTREEMIEAMEEQLELLKSE